jgi:hypothetical protein
MRILLAILLATPVTLTAQTHGWIKSRTGSQPIAYVNIGVIGKNVGTTSDEQGAFSISIDKQYENDSLRISCIGYEALSMPVSKFREYNGKSIFLIEKSYSLNELVVVPREYKERTLGITTTSKAIQAGFTENKLGYELGLMFHVKKTAVLQKLHLNIAYCDFDSVFYRVNVYQVTENNIFENILKQPIYFSFSKNGIKDHIDIDLNTENIMVEGKFLVTVEHVKNLGKGSLRFCTALRKRTYYRKTSQGNWEWAPIGISMSVDAKVEK